MFTFRLPLRVNLSSLRVEQMLAKTGSAVGSLLL